MGGDSFKAVIVIQVIDCDRLEQSHRVGDDEKWFNFAYVLKLEPERFANKLVVGYEFKKMPLAFLPE